MKWTLQLILGIALLSALLVGDRNAGSAQTFSIGTTEWHPWQIVEDTTLTGITSDLLQEITNRTDFSFNIEILPQNRMLRKFELRKIDLEPTVCSAWRENQAHISVYTVPYYTTRDVILVHRGSGIEATSAEDFAGLSLGCGLGYYYPEGFQEAFESGIILRHDNRSPEQNLIMLSLKRIDGVIIEQVQAAYLYKAFNLNPADFEIAYEFRPSEICLRLHKERQNLLPEFNSVIEAMKRDGTIEQIVARYMR